MPVSILVIAKEAGIRHLLTAVLEDIGYHVMTAGNSDSALEIIDHHTLHLIVTDIQEPKVDRRDFFRMLIEFGPPVPVVIMASSNAAEIAQKVGAVGYLDKPFTVFQARATITAAIQGTGAEVSAIVPTEQERALRVFVFTGQRFLAEMIKLTLNHGVFVTRADPDVTEAAAIIRDWRPHLVVVDQDSAGSQLLDEMGIDRAAGASPIPIISVTRNRSLGAMLLAFERGVDDVLSVPISPEELLARVLAITRRTYGQTFPLNPILRLGELEVDIVNHRLRVGSSLVSLTDTEHSLLYLLAANAGEVVTTGEILATVWGEEYKQQSDLLDRAIAILRGKLENGQTAPRYIATLPGVGYRFLQDAEQLVAMS